MDTTNFSTEFLRSDIPLCRGGSIAPVFFHGKLYDAPSRLKNVGDLLVLLPDGPDVAIIHNIVYPEVLLHPPQESVHPAQEVV